MIIFYSKSLNDVQDLANLNTLNNLIALSADMAPLPPRSVPGMNSMIISTMDIKTMVPTKKKDLRRRLQEAANPEKYVATRLLPSSTSSRRRPPVPEPVSAADAVAHHRLRIYP